MKYDCKFANCDQFLSLFLTFLFWLEKCVICNILLSGSYFVIQVTKYDMGHQFLLFGNNG